MLLFWIIEIDNMWIWYIEYIMHISQNRYGKHAY